MPVTPPRDDVALDSPRGSSTVRANDPGGAESEGSKRAKVEKAKKQRINGLQLEYEEGLSAVRIPVRIFHDGWLLHRPQCWWRSLRKWWVLVWIKWNWATRCVESLLLKPNPTLIHLRHAKSFVFRAFFSRPSPLCFRQVDQHAVACGLLIYALDNYDRPSGKDGAKKPCQWKTRYTVQWGRHDAKSNRTKQEPKQKEATAKQNTPNKKPNKTDPEPAAKWYMTRSALLRECPRRCGPSRTGFAIQELHVPSSSQGSTLPKLELPRATAFRFGAIPMLFSIYILIAGETKNGRAKSTRWSVWQPCLWVATWRSERFQPLCFKSSPETMKPQKARRMTQTSMCWTGEDHLWESKFLHMRQVLQCGSLNWCCMTTGRYRLAFLRCMTKRLSMEASVLFSGMLPRTSAMQLRISWSCWNTFGIITATSDTEAPVNYWYCATVQPFTTSYYNMASIRPGVVGCECLPPLRPPEPQPSLQWLSKQAAVFPVEGDVAPRLILGRIALGGLFDGTFSSGDPR